MLKPKSNKTKWIIGGIILFGFLITIFLASSAYLYITGISSSSSNTETQTKIQLVESMLEEYHKTHTYSQNDFFVCADMAIDVWNLVKTKGINAQIAVGNIDNPNANFTEYNHAWVFAEVEPLKWLALETTGGYVVYKETNPLYYKGVSFDNPTEFKRYMDLMKEYNAQLETINKTTSDYNKCHDEYERLRLSFNENYAGKPLSNEAVDARAEVSEKLGECNTLDSNLATEYVNLSNIIGEMKGLLT